MKKLLYSLLAAGLSFVACTDLDEDKSVVFTDQTSVTVDIKAVSDSAVVINVTPAAGAVRYAYALVKGSYTADEITEDDVLDMTSGVLKVSEVPSVSETVRDLLPNTPYTVFAVAYSEHNHASAVAVKSAVTSDGVAPALVDYSVNGKDLLLEFSEPVVIADAKKIHVYVMSSVTNKFEESEFEAIAKANVVTIAAAKAVPGIIVLATWDEGAFVDNVKLAVPAVTMEDEDIPGGVIKNEAFALDVKAAGDMSGFLFAAESKLTFTSAADLYPVTKKDNKGNVVVVRPTATVFLADATSKYEVVVPVEHESATSFSIVVPEIAKVGQSFRVVINKNSFLDEVGNSNADFEFSTAYTIADPIIKTVIGSYALSYTANGQQVSENVTIELTGEYDEDGFYGLAVSGLLEGAVGDAAPCEAYYSPEYGLLLLGQGPIGTYVYNGEEYEVYVLDLTSKGDDYYYMQEVEAGQFAGIGSYAYYLGGLGSIRNCSDVTLVKKN